MIIYVLGGVNEAPPKRVCSVIAVNNKRTVQMENKRSMYFFSPYTILPKWSKYDHNLAFFGRILTTAIIFNTSLMFKSLHICQKVVKICTLFPLFCTYSDYSQNIYF